MNNYMPSYLNLFFVATLTIAVMACGEDNDTPYEMADTETTETEQTEITSADRAKLNINTATEQDFSTIPDVGDTMVHEFEEYRPYVSIRQFRQEIGKYVDEEQVAAYERYIYVPIHRNNSDAATLRQIPGLNSSEAEELIAGRPYDANQAFMDVLSSYINDEQMAIAGTYMKER